MKENRRSFIKKIAVSGAGLAAATIPVSSAETPKKKTVQRKKTEKIRFGFIGTGSRAGTHLKNVMKLGGCEIVAICDIQRYWIETSLDLIKKQGYTLPKVYTGSDTAFEEMLAHEELDAVIISSPWEWHTRMAVASMKAKVPYVCLEVSAAGTLEECWDLVNTSESTGSQLILMENVCYRRDIMACLNMVRQTLFGEMLHGTCGYQHDLRFVKFNDGKHFEYKEGKLKMGEEAYSEAKWRAQHSIARNCDLYPTHGIGPVAKMMDIHSGNRFLSLSSYATKSRGLHQIIEKINGRDDPMAKIKFNCGDIVTSMIHCANGETIVVTHDTNSPRPYQLGFRVQGTKGLWMEAGNTVYVEGRSKEHTWDPEEPWFKEYDHPLWKKLEADALGGGHGGMDYIMMHDIFDVITHGKPSPIDCYDAAAWSAITPLSEMSIARGGTSVDFPDFTRGHFFLKEDRFAL